MMKQISVTFKDKTYKVDYPTVGLFLDSEFLKTQLSNGLYGTMAYSKVTTSYYALDIIDTEAYLSVFVSDLVKSLGVDFRKLGLEDVKELVKVYKTQLKPWIEEWQKVFKVEDENESK
jgi:citrate lyase synthetase